MGLNKYKYLVTIGCSQTYGQGCTVEETWSYKLAKELGLQEINLSCNGGGWYYIENTLTTFIDKNKDKLDSCFFILQTSMLERRINYEEIPINKSDYFEEFNIDYISPVGVAALGFKNWDNFIKLYGEDKIKDGKSYVNKGKISGQWTDISEIDSELIYFPEHKHYANSRHNWKIGPNHDIELPYIHEQFNQLMLYWGRKIYTFHLFLKSLNIDHIIVDGYSPFVSHNLNFRDYYETEEELKWVNEFWSTSVVNEKDPNDIMVYDFKNIDSKWIYDSIDIKNKIDDVILWSLYQFKTHGTDWNLDGGHAGDKGMDIIKDVIKQNLEEKGWI